MISGETSRPSRQPPSTFFARWFWLLLGAAALITAVLGLLFLDRESLWLDEGFTAWLADMDWAQFVDITLAREGMHGLYNLIMRSWTVAGSDEAWLRAPSAIFAAGAVIATGAVGRELFSPRVGLAAGLLLALNPFMLTYAREARGYALAALLSVLATYAFLRLISRPRLLTAVGYGVLGALAVYAHLFAALVLLAHALSLLAIGHRRPPLPVLATATTTLAIGLLPMLAFLLTTEGDQVDWVPATGIVDLARHVANLSGGLWTALPYFAAGAIAIAVPLAISVRRHLGVGEAIREHWPLILILLWLVIPTVVVFAISFVKPLFVSRYLIVTLPALVLLVALGWSHIRPAALSGGAMIVLVGASLLGLGAAIDEQKEDWRGAVAYVTESAAAGDVVLFYAPNVQLPFDYYRERLADPAWPRALPLGASADSVPEALAQEVAELLRVEPFEDVWLVLSHDETGMRPVSSDAIREVIAGSRRLTSETEFVGVDILHFE